MWLFLNHIQLLLKNTFLLFCLWCITSNVYSQDPFYTPINKETGLPSNAVYDIFQDNKGYIWITGDNGLNRYDGYEFKKYNSETQNSNSGSCIKQDIYGKIWYENFDGNLFFINNDTLQLLNQKSIFGYIPFAIIRNHLFAISKTGVDIYDVSSLELIKSIPIKYNFISAIQSGDQFYIETTGGILKFNYDGSFSRIPIALDITNGMSIFCESKDGILMAHRETVGKYIYQYKNNTVLNKFDSKDMNYIISLSATDTNYWVSTKKGLYQLNIKGEITNSKPYFEHFSISRVIKDEQGNLWIGTLEDGILFIPSLHILKYTYADFSPTSIINGDSGTYYIGTHNNSIYEFRSGLDYNKLALKSEKKHKIFHLNYDQEDHTLYYTESDFNSFNLKTKKRIISEVKTSIKDICKINDQYYAYAATGAAGIFRIKESKRKNEWDSLYNNSPVLQQWANARIILKSTRARSVTYNAINKHLYFCTGKGLYKVSAYNVKEILFNNKPLYLSYIRSYKNTLIGLDMQYRVLLIDKNEHTYYLNPQTTNAREIKLIRVIDNFLFIVASNGIFYCDLDKGLQKFSPIEFDLSKLDIISLSKIKNKIICITNKGLLEIHINNIPSEKNNPSFEINSMKVNDNIVELNKNTEFNYFENSIEINYSILNFIDGSNTPFYYKIGDNNWQLTNNSTRIIRLSNLSSGKYKIQFHLGEINNHKIPNKEINFEILKPIWLRGWFFTFVAIAIALLSYLYYRSKINSILKQNTLLRENIKLEQSTYKFALSSIRSQMNPHFFFNALNTIQYFIFSNDKHNASIFLSKISTLTRMILEMSTEEKVSIHKEILALTLYLELEKERFHNEFDFTIETQSCIDTKTAEIPSMLIQPFVENAVKHGLLHKKGAKQLNISFSQENGTTLVEIEDNGIGRIRSYEINNSNTLKHPSYFSEANKKRIDLLNKLYENIKINTIDLYNNQNIAIGTKVIIVISQHANEN